MSVKGIRNVDLFKNVFILILLGLNIVLLFEKSFRESNPNRNRQPVQGFSVYPNPSLPVHTNPASSHPHLWYSVPEADGKCQFPVFYPTLFSSLSMRDTYPLFRSHMLYQRCIQQHLVEKQSSLGEMNVYDLFEADFACPFQHRVGNPYGDGGKWLCAHPVHRNSSCLVYSFGSNGDFSFEADIRNKYRCDIFTFDHTAGMEREPIWKSSAKKEDIHFFPLGLGTSASNDPNLRSIRKITEMLGHQRKHIDILKVDCEQCEYEVFPEIWKELEQGMYSVGQILIEIHGLSFPLVGNFFSEAQKHGFWLFHKERNHDGCFGYGCVEFSLIHQDEIFRFFFK